MTKLKLPVTHITSDDQVSYNQILVYEDDGFHYMIVTGGSNPAVNTFKHPNTAVFLWISELRKKDINLYRLDNA